MGKSEAAQMNELHRPSKPDEEASKQWPFLSTGLCCLPCCCSTWIFLMWGWESALGNVKILFSVCTWLNPWMWNLLVGKAKSICWGKKKSMHKWIRSVQSHVVQGRLCFSPGSSHPRRWVPGAEECVVSPRRTRVASVRGGGGRGGASSGTVVGPCMDRGLVRQQWLKTCLRQSWKSLPDHLAQHPCSTNGKTEAWREDGAWLRSHHQWMTATV